MNETRDAPAAYKVKKITFLRREVPIVMQNENGPCPLLALANVLLLRNQIYLPPSTPEVTQDRLVSLVAGYMLDANNEQRLAGFGEEYKANLQQNVADAIAQLPKLATGLDVNIRFQDIRGFEFTQDVAIFDLLDVRLVHGWLVDPQDNTTSVAVGNHSYNELVSILVDALGAETPTHLITPTALQSRDSSFSRQPGKTGPLPQQLAQAAARAAPALPSQPAAAGSLPQPPPSGTKPVTSQLQGLRLDEEDSSELQQALALSMADAGSSNSGNAQTVPVEPPKPASAAKPAPPELPEAAGNALPGGGTAAEADWVNVHKADAAAVEPGRAADSEAASSGAARAGSQAVASSSGSHSTEPLAAGEGAEEPSIEYTADQLAKGKMIAKPEPEAVWQHQGFNVADCDRQEQAEAQSSISGAAGDGASERRARAHAIQDFLEVTSSQLTEHGLVSLHQDLRPNELAILFRNNHFNAIFCHSDAIWILVTDQGYLFEKDVVWERLCDVNGNTEFARADFTRFVGQPASRDITVAADLAQAAFASVVAPKGLPDRNAVADADADLALAMQLQQEEEARQRQFLAQQQQQQQPQPAAAGRRQPAAQGTQAAGRPRSGQRKGAKAKDEKCTIM